MTIKKNVLGTDTLKMLMTGLKKSIQARNSPSGASGADFFFVADNCRGSVLRWAGGASCYLAIFRLIRFVEYKGSTITTPLAGIRYMHVLGGYPDFARTGAIYKT